MSHNDIEWRPVIGYEGLYEVSSTGLVRSLDRKIVVVNSLCGEFIRIHKGKVLSPGLAGSGAIGKRYPQVQLCRDGNVKQKAVHAIVAEAFIGPCPDGEEVRHLDGNSLNPEANNLAYGTKKQNSMDRVIHGTDNRGEKNYSAKLDVSAVNAIRERFSNGESYKVLVSEYGVSDVQIYNIVNRKSWRF